MLEFFRSVYSVILFLRVVIYRSVMISNQAPDYLKIRSTYHIQNKATRYAERENVTRLVL